MKRIITPEWLGTYRTFPRAERAVLRAAVAGYIRETARNEVEYTVPEPIWERCWSIYHGYIRRPRLPR